MLRDAQSCVQPSLHENLQCSSYCLARLRCAWVPEQQEIVQIIQQVVYAPTMDCPHHHIKESSEDLGNRPQAEGEAPVNERMPTPLDPKKMMILSVAWITL